MVGRGEGELRETGEGGGKKAGAGHHTFMEGRYLCDRRGAVWSTG